MEYVIYAIFFNFRVQTHTEVLTYLLMISCYNYYSSSMSTDFTKTTKEVTTTTTQASTTIMNERYIVNLPCSCDTKKSFALKVYLLSYSDCKILSCAIQHTDFSYLR